MLSKNTKESDSKVSYKKGMILVLSFLVIAFCQNLYAQENSDCLQCHENAEMCKDFGTVEKAKIDPVTGDIQIVSMVVDQEAFATSIHGGEDFYCIDCHGDLEDSEGMHNPELKSVDCGGFCHGDPAEEFFNSNHVSLMKEKGYTPPSCKNCHIGLAFHQATWGKDRPMFVPHADGAAHRKSTIETCGNCHKKHLDSYKNGFHGQVAALGFTGTEIPTCADCHGSHNILNSSNPDSKMGEQNRIAVCGKCHDGATLNFVRHIEHPKIKDIGFYKSIISSMMHIFSNPQGVKDIGKNPQTSLLIVYVAYLGLLVMIFSKFGLHALLTWFRTVLDERKGKDNDSHE